VAERRPDAERDRPNGVYRSMHCTSCGTRVYDPSGACPSCGVPGPVSTMGKWEGGWGIRMCPACGHRGDGVPYFRRSGNAALLTAATVFTYGVGGLVFWLIKRQSLICPSCGLSWGRSRAWPGRAGTGEPGPPTEAGSEVDRPLPRGGQFRRVLGVLFALFAILLLGIGIAEREPVLGALSVFCGLSGAAIFAWGRSARQARRESILRGFERQTLRLARVRGGRLTATDVAAELDLSLAAAERVLFSMDDGFRVRSDVTEEGFLCFEFVEFLRTATDPRSLAGPSQLGGGMDRA
jgi:hypothetical protein